jgi:hypothetical protein
MKVVGVGLNKTGTSTLGACLRHWGLKVASCNPEAFSLWRKGSYEKLLQWVDRYDGFEDWPWPLIYKEIDQKYPDSKFILTRRNNAEAWFASLEKHSERMGPTDMRKYIYGHVMPQGHKEEHIRFYENHLRSVREYFKDRPDGLLEVCFEEGDGWEKLACFLGFEHPNIPFPHANKQKQPKPLNKAKVLAKRLYYRFFRADS